MDDSAGQKRRLEVMIGLQRDWESLGAERLAVLVKAQVAVMSGTLTAGHVSQALGLSQARWHKWVEMYGLEELAVECVAELDRALRAAGADGLSTVAEVQADADLSLAAGKTGVWQKP